MPIPLKSGPPHITAPLSCFRSKPGLRRSSLCFARALQPIASPRPIESYPHQLQSLPALFLTVLCFAPASHHCLATPLFADSFLCSSSPVQCQASPVPNSSVPRFAVPSQRTAFSSHSIALSVPFAAGLRHIPSWLCRIVLLLCRRTSFPILANAHHTPASRCRLSFVRCITNLCHIRTAQPEPYLCRRFPLRNFVRNARHSAPMLRALL